MGKYIDRDRLLKVLEHNFCGIGGADVMRQLIEMQPAADAAPVRHGKWKELNRTAFVGIDKFGKEIYRNLRYNTCSLCRNGSVSRLNYCPNCGARMYGEESNDGTILQNDRNRL